MKEKALTKSKQNEERVVAATRIDKKWIEESRYYPGGKSEFIREALLHYKDNRHIFKFVDIMEAIAGELLVLTKWKEKGHPGNMKWTNKHEEMLSYYERCFEILENSPYNNTSIK